MRTLKSLCFGYEKNGSSVFQKHCRHMRIAYERARNLPLLEEGNGSQIPDLIDRLCEMAGMTLEEAFSRWASLAESEDDEFEKDEEGTDCDELPTSSGTPKQEKKCRAAAERIVTLGKFALEDMSNLSSQDLMINIDDFFLLEDRFGKDLDPLILQNAEEACSAVDPEPFIQYLMETLDGLARIYGRGVVTTGSAALATG